MKELRDHVIVVVIVVSFGAEDAFLELKA